MENEIVLLLLLPSSPGDDLFCRYVRKQQIKRCLFRAGAFKDRKENIMIFDTHAHYDDEAFDQDRNQLLCSLREGGIEAVVNVGASLKSCRTTQKLTEDYPWIYGALGVHPNETGELTESSFQWLETHVDCPKIVAVGEIGLDYYWEEPDHDTQKKWFVRQLDLARRKNLPVVIHSRDAAKDTLDIMKAEKAGDMGGVIHCFSYSVEMAREFLNMGFFLGIGGVVTFKNARKVREVVEYMPLDRLVLETDSPYLAPVPNRGKRNSSLNLSYVAEEISRIKNISVEEVEAVTSRNARNLYRLIDF